MGGRHVDADVAIVGGGPAGSAAAIACAGRGLRVVLFERERVFRNRPGETLHPGIEPLLAQLGLADQTAEFAHARHAGLWVAWGGPRRFAAFGSDAGGPWSGFHVRRADFDELLLARASAMGVEVRRPVAAAGILLDGAKVGGVATAEGPVAARVVVDASGRARWLGRALAIDAAARSPRLIARYGYAEGSCPARDDAPLLSGDATGWTWTARIHERTYQWIRLSFGPQPGAVEMPDEFRGLKPVAQSRGADVTWRIAAETAGHGWFIVGDAAAVLDPTSAHGVLKAIMSGMAVGQLIAGVLGGSLPPAESAAAYRSWLGNWFGKDVAQLTRFYRLLNASLFPAADGIR